jgi:hypothetical protein
MNSSLEMKTCDCPFCPLEAMNLQCCDVKIRITPSRDKTGYSAQTAVPKAVNAGKTEEERKAIVNCLTQIVANMGKDVAVKTGNTWENQRCSFTIERTSKKDYKVCFHAKCAVEDPQ